MTEQSPQTFNVVCSGRPRAGFEHAAVSAALARLKMAPEQIGQLLGGRRLVVKRGVTATIADGYRERLWASGLDVEVVGVTQRGSATSATTDDASPSPATPPSSDISTPDTPPRIALSPAARAADRRLALRWLLAALALCAIPLTLGLLLVAVVAVTLLHAVDHAVWLQIPPWWWNGLRYGLPLLAGAALALVLLRPLLPAPRTAPPATLGRDTEPALWRQLDAIARRTGLPLPAALRPTTGCDAVATLAPGRAGWWRGDTVLTLGLALLRQPPPLRDATLAAALVEALPLTARARHFAEAIEHWLLANADGHDRCRQWLSARADGDEPSRWPGALRWLDRHYQRLAQPLFRRLLASCRVLLLPAQRAQLLTADRIATAAIGTEAFADWRRTQRCWQWATDWARPFALEHPVENLPALIAHAALQPPPALLTALAGEFGATPTPGATRPGERERIDRIAGMALPAPATAVDTEADLDALERTVTADHYRALGIEAAAPLPAEQSEQLVALLREREQAATRYFNGWLHAERGWKLPDATLIDALPLNDATEQLHVCVNEIRRLTPDRARLLASRERLQQQLAELRLGGELLALRQPFAFRTPGIEPAAVPGLIDERRRELDVLEEQLALQESIMGGRLALGLRLSGQADDAIATLRTGLDFFTALLARTERLHDDAGLLAALAQRSLPTAARPLLARLRERVGDATEGLLRRLEQAPPFPEQHVETPARRARRRLPAISGDDSAVAARALALCAACRDLHLELSLLAAEWASGSEESYAIEGIRRV